MGISGLLPALRPIERSVDLRQYAGKTVAIDGHYILYCGAIDTAKELALNKPTDSYETYFMDFMDLFKRQNVTPIVVFDGLRLPLKQDTNDERRSNRQEALKEGLPFYLNGDNVKANESFKKFVTITDNKIIDVLTKLSAEKIQCIVAPNEANAQLTYLAKTGKVDAVITEDSHLLAFGCPKIICEMNLYGQGTEITMDQVINNEDSVFYNYDIETIRHICILSGCDYLPSIKRVSLITILNIYERKKNTDRTLYNLQYKYKNDIPRGYFEKFYRANLGFLHQWVYDIDEKNYVRLNPLPKECSDDDIKLLGRIPTVQDSIKFRVNEVIPKAKPKDNPQNNDGNSPVMNALDIRSSESSPSMPKVLTQSDRLEAFYTKLHIFPRKSRKATVESATPSMTAISENANSTPQSSSYDDQYALPTTSAIPSAELTLSYEKELRICTSYQEKKPIPHHDALHSTVEQVSQNTECTTTIHKPLSSLKRSLSYYHEPLKDHDDTQEFSLPAPSSPTAPANQPLSPPFTASEIAMADNAMPENADSGLSPSTLTTETEQLSPSVPDTMSSPATATRSGQTSKSPSKKKTDPRLAKLHSTVKQSSQNMKNTRTMHKPSSSLKRSASYLHESSKDQDDTQKFSLPAPSCPTASANQPLSPLFTASETAVPENANSGSPPSTLTVKNEQLSSSIPDIVSSSPATTTRSSQASKSPNKKKTGPRLAKLHRTVKQASQNMKNTRKIHKPSSSLKRLVSYYHASSKDQDDTQKFSLPAPSCPTAPANQPLSPPFTASETAVSENADSGLSPSTLTTETEQLSSSIPDIVSSPATATRDGQTSKSPSKKKTDLRLAKLHSTVKQSSQSMKNARTIHRPSSSLRRSFSYFPESLKAQDYTQKFSSPDPSPPFVPPYSHTLQKTFTVPENAGRRIENEQFSSSISDIVSSSLATTTQSSQTSKYSASNYHEYWKDQDDTLKFRLPTPRPTTRVCRSLFPPFTEFVEPWYTYSELSPSTSTVENEQLSSSIPDTVSPATATRSGQTSKSLNKKRSTLTLPGCIVL
ncbi:unnamed protein product [Mucor circinelloides]